MSIQVVSQGKLREILLAHAEKPSPKGLRYYELPKTIGRDFWRALDEDTRSWYEPDEDSVQFDPPTIGDLNAGTRSGYYALFNLGPGSRNAWVVDS